MDGASSAELGWLNGQILLAVVSPTDDIQCHFRIANQPLDRVCYLRQSLS